MENFDCERNTALELLLPQTHLVVRGSILQRVLQLGTFQYESQHCTEPLLPRTSCPEVAFSNTIPLGNVPIANHNTVWSYF